MNLDIHESVRLARSFARLSERKSLKTILCPSFSSLYTVIDAVRGSGISVGAQDCFWHHKGAFTGEESPKMLHKLGCRYVLIGHSERRLLGETNEHIQKKLQAVADVKKSLTPIICIGESKKERRTGATMRVLSHQLSILKPMQSHSMIVAYEPIWAISNRYTHGAAKPEECALIVKQIHTLLQHRIGKEAASKIPILYGGSIDDSNAVGFIDRSCVDGLLVGGASLRLNSVKCIRDALLV